MATDVQAKGAKDIRPDALHISRSYTQTAVTSTSPVRPRASTLSHGITATSPETVSPEASRPHLTRVHPVDVFEASASQVNGSAHGPALSSPDLPEDFEELPIELISLIDR